MTVALATQATQAAAQEDVHSPNMTLLRNLPKVDGATQSDLAFQGDYAYAGPSPACV
jgi:hypothetical protein